MRIEQLQAFLAVAEVGSFQQAAQQLGVTQSTISRQIQALEADLGLPLLHRNGQTKLTVGGDRLLPRARKICQEWKLVSQELSDLLAGKQPELCVATIHSVCSYYLPPVLQRFCQDYPAVNLRVTALGSDRALKVLRDGLVDVAIVMNNRFLTTSADMVVELLYDEQIQVLMAANHPLNRYAAIPWAELANYPQVVFKDGYGMQRIVQEQFERRDLTLRAALELNTPDAFRGVIRQGEMIGLLPESSLIDAYNDPTLAIRPIESGHESSDNAPGKPTGTGSQSRIDPPLTRQVVLITTRDRLQLPPIQHFCKLATQLLPAQVQANGRVEVVSG